MSITLTCEITRRGGVLSAGLSRVNANGISTGIFFSAVRSIQAAQTSDSSLLIKLTRTACMCISSKGTSLSLLPIPGFVYRELH